MATCGYCVPLGRGRCGGLPPPYLQIGGVPYRRGLRAPTGLALQPLNAFLRPHPPGPNAVKPLARTLWELLHKNLGRAVIILAIVEIFMGLDRMGGRRALSSLVKPCSCFC